MPLEKPAYRDNLERLCAIFPDKEVLNKKEVMQFTGMSYKRIAKYFPFKGNFISKATLARELS